MFIITKFLKGGNHFQSTILAKIRKYLATKSEYAP